MASYPLASISSKTPIKIPLTAFFATSFSCTVRQLT